MAPNQNTNERNNMKTIEEIKKALEEEKAHYNKAVKDINDPDSEMFDNQCADDKVTNIEGWIEALEWVLK